MMTSEWSNGLLYYTDGTSIEVTYMELTDGMYRCVYNSPRSTKPQSSRSPSHCNAIKKDGKACNCKVKYPSTDRCGRHFEKREELSKIVKECGVCYEKSILVKLPNCTHELCWGCIKNLPRRICPYCRTSI